jgi:hypothetical protein
MEPVTVERPSWLDADFIEEALHSREQYEGITVVASRVELAVGKGDNYTSVLYRVAVEFKRRNDGDATETTSVIIKGLSTVEIMAKFLKESKVFEKETTVYQITVPAMFRLLQQNAQGRKINYLTPFCYKTSRPHTLILEDLMTLGFKMADRRARLDLAHCKVAVKSLARFHAMSVALHDEDPTSMDAYAESVYIDINRDMMSNFIESAFNALANVVEKWSGFEKHGDKFRGLIPSVWDRVVETVRAVPNSLSVLNHGDCWVNNMLFHYCPTTGKVNEARFVDFQLSRYSSPALDLQYFVYTSLSDDVRSDYTELLLEEYYKELQDTLKILGCEHHHFTLDQLKKEFEDKSFFGLMTAVTVLSAVLAGPNEIFDMENINEDGSNVDPKSVEKTYSGRRYKQAFQKLIPHFEKKGLL